MSLPAGSDPLIPWLRLFHTPGLGPRTIQRLLAHWKTPDALWAHAGELPGTVDLPPRIQHALKQATTDPQLAQRVASDWEWSQCSPQHTILYPSHPLYPALWTELPDAPVVVYVWGDPACLSTEPLAIVGTRCPSPEGQIHAQQFAYQLAIQGMSIASGLAKGIDRAAHIGALKATGQTIAILGTGIACIYPAAHQRLAHAIAEHGALVSEFPRHTPPFPAHFPRRNRLISGLSWGVLVVEAALPSGSLITARYAVEQNREVFAIPGTLTNPQSAGCHHLIQQGAKLVTCIADILQEKRLPLVSKPPSQPAPQPDCPARPAAAITTPHPAQWLLSWIDAQPQTVNTLVARTGSPAPQVIAALMALELDSQIEHTPWGYRRTTPCNP